MLLAGAVAGSAVTLLVSALVRLGGARGACPVTGASGKCVASSTPLYSMADQVARFAHQKRTGCKQALSIESIYNPEELSGKRVLVTGANRGLGLAICKELVDKGAEVVAVVRKASADLKQLKVFQTIEGVDVTSDKAVKKMAKEVNGQLDIVINNAGIFMVERESILNKTMDFADEVKTIDVCAVGPLRIVSTLWNEDKIKEGGKIAMITSQGGSLAWRSVQSPNGGDYGHHMSKAAANMAGVLCANELQGKVSVAILHPGFNRTEMTAKYSHIWDVEGAVDPSVGAQRVCHEIVKLTPATSGILINCEDGLPIHW